jgi:hypothetical protein
MSSPQYQGYAPASAKTNGLAIAALVIGYASIAFAVIFLDRCAEAGAWLRPAAAIPIAPASVARTCLGG